MSTAIVSSNDDNVNDNQVLNLAIRRTTWEMVLGTRYSVLDTRLGLTVVVLSTRILA